LSRYFFSWYFVKSICGIDIARAGTGIFQPGITVFFRIGYRLPEEEDEDPPPEREPPPELLEDDPEEEDLPEEELLPEYELPLLRLDELPLL
jgi:hypothetical protein